ncbi:MAG: amidohydrolase family protein [Candidatus Pacearchaeota archaeon]
MIDHHVHLGKDTKTKFYLDPKTISNRLDLFNLKGAIIFACPHQNNSKFNPYEKANNQVYSASLINKRLIPFMFVHPILDKLEYVTKEETKFKGFKLYPRSINQEYSYDYISDRRIIDLISESKKPAIFHTGFREGSRIKDLIWILERKDSPVIFVHSGDLIDEDLQRASRYPNVYIDVAPLNTMLEREFFVDKNKRNKAVSKLNVDNILNYLSNLFGKQRVLWGSDSPWCDNLIEEGYKKEIEILEKMRKLGFSNNLFL